MITFVILVLNLLALNSLILYKKNASLYLKNINLGFYCLILIAFTAQLINFNINYYSFNFLQLTNINYWFLLFFIVSFLIAVIFLLQNGYTNSLNLGFLMFYLNAGIGAVLSTNILNLFIYWELLALLAGIIIALSNNPLKRLVSLKYLIIHIFGGVLLFIGVLNYINEYGYNIQTISLNNPINYFILAGILINLGVLPFSSWLIDGYSTANPYNTIFLSIITTKVAILTLYNLFNASSILIIIGFTMSIYAFIFALFQNNILKLMSLGIIYSLSLSIIAIGVSSNLNILLYILTTILSKMLLFFIIAILYKQKNSLNIYNLKNTVALKSFYGFVLVFSALEGLGFIGFSSFVGKTIISLAIEELHNNIFNYLFLVLSGLYASIISIKIPFFLLNFKNNNNTIKLNNKFHSLPYILTIGLLITISALYTSSVFNLSNVLHSLEVIGISVIIFTMSYFALKNKEEKINSTFSLAKYILFFLSYNLLYKLANINIFYYLYKLSIVSIKQINTNLYLKYQKTSSIAFIILITFCTLYIFMIIL